MLFAIILGIVQGISEFLPISSSAHLIVISSLFHDKPLALTLNVALHLGTACAVVVYFYRDWWRLLTALLYWRDKNKTKDRLLFLSIIVGSIPAGIIGVFFKSTIEHWFHNPQITALPLAVVGVILYGADRWSQRHNAQLSLRSAFIIGLCQAVALIPGVSRSGATISGARLLGFNRLFAARFSFLLGTPAMLGAAALVSVDLVHNRFDDAFYVGILTSFVVGLITIRFFLTIINKWGFLPYMVYRLLLAALIVGIYY